MVLFANVLLTESCLDHMEGRVRLNPRALSFESELYHRLNGTDGREPGPLLDPVTVAWRDVGRENEDGVHLVLNAGNRSYDDWSAIVDMATRNRTGGQVATTVIVTSYLPVLGLPRAALAAVPYRPLTISPSASYTWAATDTSSTVSFWEALWNGAAEILDVTWQYVRSAVAFYVDFYVGFVESLVQFGLWVSHQVQEAWAEEVQPAVEAAGAAFGQMVEWALGFIREAANAILSPILTPLNDAYNAWIEEVYEAIAGLFTGSYSSDREAARGVWGAITAGSFFGLVIGLAITMETVEYVLNAVQNLVPSTKAFTKVIKPTIAKALGEAKDALIKVTLGTILLSTSYLLGEVLPLDDPVWSKGTTWGTSLAGAVSIIALWAIDGIGHQWIHISKGWNDRAWGKLVGDPIGLAVALLGLWISLRLDQSLFPVETAIIGASLAGLGLATALAFRSWNDDLGVVGFIDEGVDIAVFGLSLANLKAAMEGS